ncbi:homospermidine biosynthesis protein [Dictyobacter formicarum]|uniref:Deoxyhypusine synthase-like protein n=1 Tax=Dictyobacter formicarum TaxID=2778368 RepID=A0ABQ3VEI6_9CHLR|nr:deoxyhypusine synthase [Dictyobacter formicarum]GHO84154.1 deoxyhypusine synthase-like protein [Dictyobacter formicarum]
MTHHHDSSEKHSSALLSGAQILPRRVRPNMTVAELIDEQFQAYNGARLNEAARVYAERMLDPAQDVTVGLTMAGALTPAGLGGCVLTLMEYGFVDFIISTGANLYHDMHHALAMSLHRGDFRLDDVKLQEEGVIRIYDILFDDQVLLDTDAFVRESLRSLPNHPISTSELHYHLGQQLLKAGVKPEYSVLAQAAAWNVPIYTSSPGDSSIGMNVARNALEGSQLTLDPLADVNETTAIVHHATRNGVIILGGGSPKNFYLQTQPQLWEVLGIQKGGHDYFIQVTADAPHWGGLSGATPSEAVSWGKIKPDQLNNAVVVYGDSTIALPLLTSYAVSKAQPRPRRELFARRQEMLDELKEAYETGKKERP